jgi:hypothetical protein
VPENLGLDGGGVNKNSLLISILVGSYRILLAPFQAEDAPCYRFPLIRARTSIFACSFVNSFLNLRNVSDPLNHIFGRGPIFRWVEIEKNLVKLTVDIDGALKVRDQLISLEYLWSWYRRISHFVFPRR